MMNSVEEYQNLVELLKQALLFYADKSNYVSDIGFKPYVELDDYGSQARFALKRIEELDDIYGKMEIDNIKLIENEEFNVEDLLRTIKTMNDNLGDI